ncbi:MAG: hypothetical protein HZT42_08710 [Paracoccaceae bacterium]|nr:MAG: hypothetical protein HZT42_08710 [Paracoccaceae bacterium]
MVHLDENFVSVKEMDEPTSLCSPLLCDEQTYRAYEVFHVDAVPSLALLDGGRTLLVDNKRDESFDVVLRESGLDTEKSILLFALQYIEQMTNEPVAFAGDESIDATHRPGNIVR